MILRNMGEDGEEQETKMCSEEKCDESGKLGSGTRSRFKRKMIIFLWTIFCSSDLGKYIQLSVMAVSLKTVGLSAVMCRD